jgi:hypothetical protein
MAKKKTWKKRAKAAERGFEIQHLDEITDTVADLHQRITSVYRERDRLVAALAKIFPSHLRRDPGEEVGFQTTVCIHLPAGQATWHLADDELVFFDFLTAYDLKNQAVYDTCQYDGHTTQAKYERLSAIQPPVNWTTQDGPLDKANT